MNFRFATTDKSTAAVSLGATHINVNYAVYEDFETSKGWVKSDGSTDDSLAKDVSAVRSFNPVSGKVVGEMFFLLPKAESITYALRSVSPLRPTIKTSTPTASRFTKIIMQTCITVFALRPTPIRKRRLSKSTAARSAKSILPEAATSADNILVSNASETVPTLSDFRVFRKWEHDDYVPRPVVPKGEEKYTVGMNVCSLWTNGTRYRLELGYAV